MQPSLCKFFLPLTSAHCLEVVDHVAYSVESQSPFVEDLAGKALWKQHVGIGTMQFLPVSLFCDQTAKLIRRSWILLDMYNLFFASKSHLKFLQANLTAFMGKKTTRVLAKNIKETD